MTVSIVVMCVLLLVGSSLAQTRQQLYDLVISEYARTLLFVSAIGGDLAKIGDAEFQLVIDELKATTDSALVAIAAAEAASISEIDAEFTKLKTDFQTLLAAIVAAVNTNGGEVLDLLKAENKRLIDLIGELGDLTVTQVNDMILGGGKVLGVSLDDAIKTILSAETPLNNALKAIEKSKGFIFGLGDLFKKWELAFIAEAERIKANTDAQVDDTRESLLKDTRRLAADVEARRKVLIKALEGAKAKVKVNGELLDVNRQYLIDLWKRIPDRFNGYNAGGPNLGKILGRAKAANLDLQD